MTKQDKNFLKFNNCVYFSLKNREENVIINKGKTIVIQIKIEREIRLTDLKIGKLSY